MGVGVSGPAGARERKGDGQAAIPHSQLVPPCWEDAALLAAGLWLLVPSDLQCACSAMPPWPWPAASALPAGCQQLAFLPEASRDGECGIMACTDCKLCV